MRNEPIQVVLDMIEAEKRADLNAILQCFATDAVIFTAAGLKRGQAAIREDFIGFLSSVPTGFWDSFETLQTLVHEDMVHLIWRAGPFIQYGADFFIVRDGKIRVQTYAFYPQSLENLAMRIDFSARQADPFSDRVIRSIYVESHNDIDGALREFADDAVLFTPHGLRRGMTALRTDLADFLREVDREFWGALQMHVLGHDGVVHNIWRGEPAIRFGTDTFVIRDSRIVAQAYAFHPSLSPSPVT